MLNEEELAVLRALEGPQGQLKAVLGPLALAALSLRHKGLVSEHTLGGGIGYRRTVAGDEALPQELVVDLEFPTGVVEVEAMSPEFREPDSSFLQHLPRLKRKR